MRIDQFIDLIFPLIFGIGGIYLFLHSRFTIRRRNTEIENSWQAHKKDDE